LSKLDDAMRKHIAYLVLKEGRPLSCADLLEFEVNGFQYHMVQGTSRNKVSAMLKTGEALDQKESKPLLGQEV
jgi:hypothetical protein